MSFIALAAIGLWACKSKQPKANPATVFAPTAKGTPIVFFEATASLLQENYSTALAKLQHCKNQMQDSSGWYGTRAVALLGLKNYEQANAALDTALLLEPKNTDYLDLKAKIWLQTGDYTKAASIYEQMATLNTKSYSLYEDAAKYYLKSNKIDELIRVCDSWIYRFDLNERAAYYKINAFVYKGNYNSAIEILHSLQQKYPERERYEIKEIQIELQNNNLNAAYQKAKNAYTLKPNNTELEELLLRVSIMKYETASYQAIINKWCTTPPEMANKVVEILQLAQSNHIQLCSNDCLKKWNTHYGNNAKWNNWYAKNIAKTSNADEMYTAYEQAVANNPNDIAAWQKWLDHLYFVDKTKMKAESTKFMELYPLMSLAVFYEYSCFNSNDIDAMQSDEYILACKWRSLFYAKKLTAELFKNFETDCAASSNPIILMWLSEAAAELKMADKRVTYKNRAMENGAIIELLK